MKQKKNELGVDQAYEISNSVLSDLAYFLQQGCPSPDIATNWEPNVLLSDPLGDILVQKTTESQFSLMVWLLLSQHYSSKWSNTHEFVGRRK